MEVVSDLSNEKWAVRLIHLCFFLSGFCCLVYQVVWQRMIVRELGATLPAVSVTLACMMGGFALGSFIFERLSARALQPVRIYACIEVAIGLFGLASPILFSGDPGSPFFICIIQVASVFKLQPHHIFDAHFWLRSTYIFLVLGFPAILMGGTFPLVGQGLTLHRQDEEHPSMYGSAYAVNLLGALIGAAACGFCLIPQLGLRGTVMIASTLSLITAIVAFKASLNSTKTEFRHTDSPLSSLDEGNAARSGMLVSCLFILVFACGFIGMSLEVIWTRLFCLILGSSTYAFASVLAVHLAGLAVGALGGQILILRKVKASPINKPDLALIGALMIGLALWLYADILLVPYLPWLLSLMQSGVGNSFAAYLGQRITIVLALVLIPAVITGSIFPLALQIAAPLRQRSAGSLFTASCAGAVSGSLLTGLVLITGLGTFFNSGIEATVVLLICLSVSGSLAAAAVAKAPKKSVFFAASVFILILLSVRPTWNRALITSGVPFLSLPVPALASAQAFSTLIDSPNNRLIFYREGLNTTVTVNTNQAANVIYLKNDGKVEAALPLHSALSKTSDIATHVLMGQLPALISKTPVAKIFVVGLGSGATCGAALENRQITQLQVSEVEPAVFEAEPLFQESNGKPLRKAWLDEGRISKSVEDARTILQFDDTKYDAIISQPAEPWISGSADLYTTQFWQIAKSRLKPTGLFCQWIQLYSINPQCLGLLCRTFQSVFPHTYILHYPSAGEIILVGGDSDFTDTNLRLKWKETSSQNAGISKLVNDPAEIKSLIVASPGQLLDRCRALADKYHDSRQNTDDNLVSEYMLPAQLYKFGDNIEENLECISVSGTSQRHSR